VLPFILAWALSVPNQTAQPDVAARAKEAVGFLSAQNFAAVEAQFTEQMTAALPAGRLGATWTALVAQVGPFKSCGSDVRIRSLSDKQMVITPCEFERAKVDIQIAFNRDGRISGLAVRPALPPPAPYALPPYASPAAYTEEELTIGGPEWPLPATLAMPVGQGPFPALVLVHGSGPNDRDETLGPNKPFKDLAAGLASTGVAVLRYDKRTKVHPAKLAAVADFTVKQEVVDDVLEAVRALRLNPKVNRARVFVLGHSLGGMLIPRIGAADPSLAGLIVMAGAARSLEDAIVEQTRYIAMADGVISPEEQARIDEAARVAARVKALTPKDAKSGANISGAPASYWLDLRGYDAPSAAKALEAPMLVLQGERDYQVTMDELAKWKAALGSKPGVTFRTYPALNHLFMPGTGKSLPPEYDAPSHVAEDVIRDIADWIKRIVTSAGSPRL
jgi:dienelactone hydrolase